MNDANNQNLNKFQRYYLRNKDKYKQYYNDHKEKIINYSKNYFKNYYNQNRDKYRQYLKNYYNRNKDKIQKYQAHYQAQYYLKNHVDKPPKIPKPVKAPKIPKPAKPLARTTMNSRNRVKKLLEENEARIAKYKAQLSASPENGTPTPS